MDDENQIPNDAVRVTENMRTATAIIRLIDDLERMDPNGPRQIEAPTLYVLARRAAYSGHGGDLLALIHAGLAEGERDRACAEAEQHSDGFGSPSSIVGHA
jgi:hypothetical protein